MKKKTFRLFNMALGILLALMSAKAFTQEANASITLEEVSQLLAEYPYIRGNFIQDKYIPSINRTLTSSGKFVITSKEGIIWQTEKPYPSIMVVGINHLSQGTTVDSMTKMDTSSNRLFVEFATAISSAFSGNLQEIHNTFYVNFVPNGSQWQLFLEPREQAVSQIVKSIQLQGKNVLDTITMVEQNGSIITYHFSQHSFSQEPTEYEKQLLAR